MLKYFLVIAFVLSPVHFAYAKSNQFQTFPAWQTQPPKVPNVVQGPKNQVKGPKNTVTNPKKGK